MGLGASQNPKSKEAHQRYANYRVEKGVPVAQRCGSQACSAPKHPYQAATSGGVYTAVEAPDAKHEELDRGQVEVTDKLGELVRSKANGQSGHEAREVAARKCGVRSVE